MTLHLIGLGVGLDITTGGLSSVKKCSGIYLETYTNPFPESSLEALEKVLGKKIERVGRDRVESDFLVEMAENADIALLSSGDPLTATTHVTLVMEARKRGIPVKIVHNSSVYTAAAGKAGLQIYRFGKTATLVNPRENYRPTSSLEVIRSNLKNDMHTLVLLDTEPEPMEAEAALEMLAEFDSAVVLSRLGLPDEKITYGKVRGLSARNDFGKPPFCIIVPAKLHPVEEEFLALL